MNLNFIPLESVSTCRIDLDSIQIAAPCRADWDAMSGDDQVRHCKSCAKNVYNLSALTRAQAVRLIEEKEGHLCVQLHRREDGTLLTADCTIGISDVKKAGRGVRNLVAGVMAAILSLFGVSGAGADSNAKPKASAVQSGAVGVTMGEMPPETIQSVRGRPVMGKPAPIRTVPIRTVTMGRMKMPATTKIKVVKKHATNTSKAAGKTGTPRNRRPRG